MFRHIKRIVGVACVVAMVWLGGAVADSARLREDILRLHVVAASDTEEDQAVKLQVRDAILGSLKDGLEKLSSPEEAYAYVQSMLPQLEETANRVLKEAGFADKAAVSLGEEAFPIREYDTFTLPSGVYQSLRVVIGEGEGHNWWCVVFPQLCLGATSQEFVETANTHNMPRRLSKTLTGDYEIRFWVLDKLGELENFFHDTSE